VDSVGASVNEKFTWLLPPDRVRFTSACHAADEAARRHGRRRGDDPPIEAVKEEDQVADRPHASQPGTVTEAMNEAPLSTFHFRAFFTSGMGFFTDAYDLFIIGTATVLITKQWHLTSSETGLINSMSLVAGFSLLGMLLTLLIPEPAKRSLEDVSGEDEVVRAAEAIVASGGLAGIRDSA
jgi:hypothetical protein